VRYTLIGFDMAGPPVYCRTAFEGHNGPSLRVSGAPFW
jgi:hypothetical protein